MKQLTTKDLTAIAGGSADRESNQAAAALFVGGLTGGNGYAMTIAAWAAGRYYDLSNIDYTNAPTGPSSNHLTRQQWVKMRSY